MAARVAVNRGDRAAPDGDSRDAKDTPRNAGVGARFSTRTKAALAAAKARGVKLGNPRLLAGSPGQARMAAAAKSAKATAPGRGWAGSGIHSAMLRAHARAFVLSAIPGNRRRNSIALPAQSSMRAAPLTQG